MAKSIDTLKVRNKKLEADIILTEEDRDGWHTEAKTLKFQNVLLRNTIN